MARLKVKQISDFTSAVQNLIDIDVDQNAASISSALSAGVSAGVFAGNVSTELSEEVASIDLILGAKADGSGLTAVSDALSVEIAATNSDVTRIDGLLASVATDGELSTEVASIDTRISNEEITRSVDVKAVSDAVSTILAGSTTDLDQFAEVIAYVDSLDTADGGALTTQIASLETVVSTNSSLDVVLSDALSTEVAATNADVDSIDVVLGTIATDATVTAISDALSVEIAATNTEVDSIDVRATAIEADVAGNSSNTVYAHQLATFRSATTFALAQGLRFGANDDLLVFINGHNIHKQLGEGSDGYATVDGVNFSLASIGYDIDANDHIYVTGVIA